MEESNRIGLLWGSHLVLREASVLLQHLQQLLMFPIKLGDFLSVELQELPRRTQVCQSLMDGGKRGVMFFTRGMNFGSMG